MSDDGLGALLGKRAQGLDLFDRVQLAEVVKVCAASRSASDAGRKLFAHSRLDKRSSNDATGTTCKLEARPRTMSAPSVAAALLRSGCV